MSCSVCNLNPIKYTCPACGVKTCSFPCVQKHKQDSKCTGTVDQTKFLGKKELSSTDSHINRDYNFLMNLGRNINLGKDDIKSNAKNVFKRQFHQRNNNASQNNSNKRFKTEDIDPRKYLVNKVFPNSPPSIIRRNNTLVVQLPAGMSRATSNKTGYDKRLGTFIWTIEWVFIDLNGEEVTRFLSYRMKEGTVLRDAFPMNILNKSLAKGKENENESHAQNEAEVEKDTNKENVQLPVQVVEKEGEAAASSEQNDKSKTEKDTDKSELCFYLENILDKSKKRSIIKLSPELPISEVLTDKVVLEFPTIYVTRNENTWKEYISEQFGEVSSEESSSDSSSSEEDSSDESSDDSSDYSSGEESSENESDDGPPESSSSKPIENEITSVRSPTSAVQDETAAEHSA